jgi:AhpD family alkylhydroperoxidase|tara:strand:+ start:658 stop:1005 length:348 start_codon:yes stop_codon:yes gene_type:complete
MSFTMDWKKLTGETKQNFAKFHKVSPETFDGFGIMGKDAKKDGHLSEKTKEFIALGISIAVRCESCIGLHVEHLVRLGATKEELVEALSMSSYMGGGPSITYSAKALDAFEQLSS